MSIEELRNYFRKFHSEQLEQMLHYEEIPANMPDRKVYLAVLIEVIKEKRAFIPVQM